MEEDNYNSAIFTTLKPICDHLLMDVNDKSVSDFHRILDTLPPKAIMKFQDYIIFPIEIQIHKSSSDNLKLMLIDLMAKLFSRCFIDSDAVLLRISTLLYQQLVITNDQIEVAEVSEELKLSVVLCLSNLWKSAMSDVMYNIYCKKNHPRLGPVVYLLVQLAKNEKLTRLRVSALECLQILCQVHPDSDENDIELRQRARDIVCSMLPGIVSCCFSIANEPATLNHKVTCANISTWCGVVRLAMSDQESTQSSEWLQKTSEKLIPITEAVLRAQTHTHWQVRHQLATATFTLLSHCSRNLSASVGSLVCCLIVLSEDEMREVSEPAVQSLSELSDVLHQDTGQPLLELVESAFYSLLSRAPRIMQGTDENSQLTCLSLLVGYLRLQGPKLSQVLCFGPFLNRLLLTLAHISRLDTSQVTLLEDCSVREVETEMVAGEPWKQMMFLNTSQKIYKHRELCNVLRQYADLNVITYALLDLFDSSPELTKELIFLLNSILGGGEPESMSGQPELVKTVISVYHQPRLWDVPFTVKMGINLPQAQSNVIQVSLLADGLGLLALAVGGKHFSSSLLHCLYPLLECAGSPLHTLASAGLMSVQRVAQACVGGVTELVCANVDYLSHHITLRLRRAHHSPGVLGVLTVVMRHTNINVLPSLREIIEDVLSQSRDEFQDHNTNAFLRVFLTFVTCVRGWQDSQTTPESKINLSEKTESSLSPLGQILEYHHLLDTANSLEDNEPLNEEINEDSFKSANPQMEAEENSSVKQNSKPLSASVQLTVAVLQRALHFLPSKNEQRQILVLDIMREGLLVLASEEDQLLPMVHKIWSPLVNRFKTSVTRPLVMHRAFLLLCTLASTAKDFIRSRTFKEVLPSLCQVLTMNAEASLLKDKGSAYRLTQQFKLQKVLLSNLGHLSIDLCLQEKESYQILSSASPYLSVRQPIPLQECSVELFKKIGSKYPDMVWLQLLTLWYPRVTLTPPSITAQCQTIQVETCCNEKSEYQKNQMTTEFKAMNRTHLVGLLKPKLRSTRLSCQEQEVSSW